MSDPLDPSAFRESRPGVPDGGIERRGYADDDDFDVSLRRTPFPPMMLAAGILWIVSGVMLLSLSALSFYLGDSSNIIWTGIGSLFFLKDGVQLLRGSSFRDPKADGVLCIAIAGWIFFQGVFRYQATESLVALGVAIVFAGVILIPGILVLVGRQQYMAWQAEKNATSP